MWGRFLEPPHVCAQFSLLVLGKIGSCVVILLEKGEIQWD